MSPPLLHLRDIALTFGGTPLIENAELTVSAGERIALVGRNGSGKSTLLRIAAGLMEADRGTRFVHPDATVRYLPQEPDFGLHGSVGAYVESGLGPGDDPYRARMLLDELGLTGDEVPGTLSGGEGRRAALARALAPDPDILLLDEPTNHLDLTTIEWLEGVLAARRGALVLISHDRRFLDTLSRVTVWLDRGRTRRLDIGFSAFEAERDRLLDLEEQERHKLDRRIAAEEDWVRYGVTARRKRNVKRMARLQSLRQTRREERRAQGQVTLKAAQADQSGTLVLEACDIAKAFGPLKVVEGLSLRLRRGDRLGIVGPNGAGKTTLIRLLTGVLTPDSGEVRLGANLEAVMLDQRRDALDPNWTLTEALTGGSGDTVTVGDQTRHVVSYMKDFLFSAEQARTPVRVLSGGERGRLALARALARPSNLLVLDEPTNDLDLETLDVLEEMLSDYAGTVLLISHDRDFLDRIVGSVLVPEGEGHWQEHAGGYTDMLRARASLSPRRGQGQGQQTRRGQVASEDRQTEPEPAKADASERATSPRTRLTFQERHDLERLPGVIDSHTALLARLQQALAEPDLYARDRARFDALMAKLDKVQRELTAAEERWLALELKQDTQQTA